MTELKNSTEESPLLRVEHIDTVVRLTLNRPAAANALNEPLQQALVAALRLAEADDSIGAVVLEGAGGRIFSAGADLKEHADIPLAESRRRRRENLRVTMLALLDVTKPLIACVHGKAIGAGCMLAILADEIFANPEAQFSMPEVRIGMPTPLGATIAARRGGHAMVQRLVLAGQVLTAQEACARGLIDKVVDTADLSSAAIARARELVTLHPRAYAETKRWANLELKRSVSSSLDEAARLAE